MNIYKVLMSNSSEHIVQADSFAQVEEKILKLYVGRNISIESITFLMKIDL